MMRRSHRVSVLAVGCVLAVVLTAFALHSRGGRTDGWQEEETGPFSMSLPPDMRSVPTQGIDSYVGEYRSATIILSFDYGAFTGDLSGWPKEGTIRQVTINGHPAKLGTKPSGAGDFPLMVAGNFPLKKDSPSWALGLYAQCKTPGDVATAQKIIESVHLHPESWKNPTLWQRFRRWLHL